ncbi:hypothetical protein Kisp02_44120 [Kineosporia sp. NBRC 101731]|nr:hypothetical protein Kisp02_44120 [Kineosporia sp. NBRC 101731]
MTPRYTGTRPSPDPDEGGRGGSRLATQEGARITASFSSAPPEARHLDLAVLENLLVIIELADVDLETGHPNRKSFAGHWPPVPVLRDPARFDDFTFDPATGPAAATSI